MLGSVFLLGLLLFAVFANGLTNVSLQFYNRTLPSYIPYDRADSDLSGNTYGASAYMDNTPGLDNLYLSFCHPQLRLGDKVDLLYASENRSLFASVVNFLPLVTQVSNYTNVTEPYNCTFVDVALSSTRAIYPGYISPVLVSNTTSNYDHTGYDLNGSYLLNPLTQWFNGSYDLQIRVEGPPKVYHISTQQIYDEYDQIIDTNGPFMVTSFVDEQNETLVEAVLDRGSSLAYDQEIVGGEQVIVNGIPSLEIIAYDPCTPINGSGYYIMNDSIWNYNDTCVVINETDNLVLNFGNEIIDGDGFSNGSYTPDRCSIIVADSENVTLENFQSQQYYYGLCIENSSVTVFGTGVTNNFVGSKIYGASNATLVGLTFSNNNSELASYDGSVVNIIDFNVSTAILKSEFVDAIVRGVSNPPPFNISGLVDIEQFVEYTNTSNGTSAQINFYYEEPLPNNAVTDNITIYKYDSTSTTYIVEVFNESDNSTYNVTYVNETGNWTSVYTLVSPSENLIISPTITSFSIFAPFAEEGPPIPDPTPEPQPDPTPEPQAGSGSGEGGSPITEEVNEIFETSAEEPLILELKVPENVTLMQGEAGIINFSIYNKGDSPADGLSLGPLTRPGWDYTNYSLGVLQINETVRGEFQLAPFERELPGTYLVPVNVYVTENNESDRVLTELMEVRVIPRGTLKRLKVIEYPPEIRYRPFAELDISLLIENIGDRDLPNITVDVLDNDCLRKVEGQPTLLWGATRELDYRFFFSDGKNCKINLKFYSEEDLVGFLPLDLVLEQRTTLFELPEGTTVQYIIWSLILLIWSGLAIWVIERRRRRLR